MRQALVVYRRREHIQDMQDAPGTRGDAGWLGVRARGSGLDLPGVCRSAVRPLPGMPISRSSRGGEDIRPDSGIRPSSTSRRSASRSRPRSRWPSGFAGASASGAKIWSLSLFRGRCHVRRLIPRGSDLRRGDEGASVLFCSNNQWAISTPVCAVGCYDPWLTRRSGTGYRECGSTDAMSSL